MNMHRIAKFGSQIKNIDEIRMHRISGNRCAAASCTFADADKTPAELWRFGEHLQAPPMQPTSTPPTPTTAASTARRTVIEFLTRSLSPTLHQEKSVLLQNVTIRIGPLRPASNAGNGGCSHRYGGGGHAWMSNAAAGMGIAQPAVYISRAGRGHTQSQ